MSFKDSPNWMGTAEDSWIPKIKELLIPGSVLDIGCGHGRFNAAFEGHDYLGIDINAEVCAANPLKHKVMDINDFEWRDFDNVFSWVSLQHVKNPPFEEIRKHAKNLILCEGLNCPVADYQFSHDWEKLFPGIKIIESISGPATLMHWRRDV